MYNYRSVQSDAEVNISDKQINFDHQLTSQLELFHVNYILCSDRNIFECKPVQCQFCF